MNTQLTKIKEAAKYYLRYQGQTGTGKQVDRIMNQFSGNQIIKMASERGFKIALLLLALSASLTSCTKSEPAPPTAQSVTYTLKCKDCLIYLESDKWNRHNELERSKRQYFNVSGDFSYTFTNKTGLDSVQAQVSVSVMYESEQLVELTISDNQGRSTRVIDTLGFSPDWSKNNPYELEAKLALR